MTTGANGLIELDVLWVTYTATMIMVKSDKGSTWISRGDIEILYGDQGYGAGGRITIKLAEELAIEKGLV